jgi:hypothetical protein
MDFDDSSRTLSAGSVLSEGTLVPEDDDLSDAQIDFLLQRASLRMKSKSGMVAEQDKFAVKLPQLHGAKDLPTSYSKVENGVAKVDEKKTTNEEQRKLAEKPRKIEDPVALKKSKKERKSIPFFLKVCIASTCDDTLRIAIRFLDADHRFHSGRRPAQMRVLFFIVTLTITCTLSFNI